MPRPASIYLTLLIFLLTGILSANGNGTRKVMPNGSGTLSTFDALNRKLTEQTRNGGGTGGLVSTFDYSQPTGIYPGGHDNVGNVLKIVEDYGHASVKDRLVTNTYDRTYRLVTEIAAETGGSTVTTSYGHDKANNRTEKIVTGGSNPGTWTFPNGTTADDYNSNQVKSVIKGATLTTIQTYGYDYDHENRLTSLTDSAKGSFAYSYDHRTRRVGRDETGASGTEDEVSFVGGLSVQEYINGSGTPTVEYVRGSDYGGGIGGVLYTNEGNTSPIFNHYNSRGDVVSQTNNGGGVEWEAAYEAFGTRTVEDGTPVGRQRANTKDEDPTGLLNEGFRYRDLEVGVFLTRDPAGFVDGPNVYTYVRQNPWTFVEPLGLQYAGPITMEDQKRSAVMWAERMEGPEAAKIVEARYNAGIAKVYKVTAVVGVATGAAVVGGPFVAAGVAKVGLTGTAAGLTTAAGTGALSGVAGNMTSNALDGRPLTEGNGEAALYGAATGMVLQSGVNAVQGFKQGLAEGAATVSPTVSVQATNNTTAQTIQEVTEFGPFFRVPLAGEMKLVEASGLVGGKASRNIYAGYGPMVKASNEVGEAGYKFWTTVKPLTGNKGMNWSYWRDGDPGVVSIPGVDDVVGIPWSRIEKVPSGEVLSPP